VMQEDILTTTLTVRETVLFSARLRIPNSVTLAEKEAKVDKILEQLGLSHVSENIIGEPGARGISGGERKRVSIAIEMVTDPSLLFLDEPTSSIDSTSAYGVVDHLKKLCTANGTTVIATIHQPSSQVFLMFDKVLLLSEGRQLYYGDSGDIVDYFTNYGFTAPKLVNPADYILDLANTKMTSFFNLHTDSEKITELSEKFWTSEPGQTCSEELQLATQNSTDQLDSNEKISEYALPWFSQFMILLQMSIKSLIRDPMQTFVRIFQNVVTGLLIGLIYLQLGKGQADVLNRMGAIFFSVVSLGWGGIAAIGLNMSKKAVFLREVTSGFYSVSAYFLSDRIAQLPGHIAVPLVFALIFYWMAALRATAASFFTFYAIAVLTDLCSFAFVSMLTSLVPIDTIVSVVTPLAFTIFMLFGGFFAITGTIPAFIAWLEWLSFFRYAFFAAAINEFEGVTFKCPPEPEVCFYPTGDSILRVFGADDETIFQNVIIIVALWVGFSFLHYIGLLIASKKKR